MKIRLTWFLVLFLGAAISALGDIRTPTPKPDAPISGDGFSLMQTIISGLLLTLAFIVIGLWLARRRSNSSSSSSNRRRAATAKS